MSAQNESPVTAALSILEMMIGQKMVNDMASVPQHLRDITAAIEAIQATSPETVAPVIRIIKGMIENGAVKALGDVAGNLSNLGQALLGINVPSPAAAPAAPAAPVTVQAEAKAAPAAPAAKKGGRPPKAKPQAEPAPSSLAAEAPRASELEHKAEVALAEPPAPTKAARGRPKSVPAATVAQAAAPESAKAAPAQDVRPSAAAPRRQKQPLKAPDANGKLVPAVHPKDSVTGDFIVCLEDGKKMKMLKKHLNIAFGITPDEYRKRWGLPENYPMVAPNYARQKSRYARSIGLGTNAMRSEVASKRERETA